MAAFKERTLLLQMQRFMRLPPTIHHERLARSLRNRIEVSLGNLMQPFSILRHMARTLTGIFLGQCFPVLCKQRNELNYWRGVKKTEGQMSNEHYKYFYTHHFGFDVSYYNDKVILDLGCGPRGSLEWADKANRRIGLDPLVNKYLKLGANQHRMEYINAPFERIPLRSAECDAVFSFNSLDHVEDIGKTIQEIKRIVRPSGIFLLLVEVNHPPTPCEPHEITPAKLLDDLLPEFECELLDVYEPVLPGMYDSILADKKLRDPHKTTANGYLSAKFKRTACQLSLT